MSTLRLQEPVKAILLDIEGTTTPISFVYQTLFPHARREMGNYLRRQWSQPDVQADWQALRADHAADLAQGLHPPLLEGDGPEAVVPYLRWLIDRDRKSTALKSLQGKIWEEGYRTGLLKSEVFADVFPAFRRWRGQGRRIAIYSSGSVLAQKLLFAFTCTGDLSGFIDCYFDTNVGAKKEADSYRRIAGVLHLRAEEIVFVSDVDKELEAAQTAGMQVLLSVRPGNPPPEPSCRWQAINTFDDICSSGF